MENKILNGDALHHLKELPEKSVNMVMTSPPYWALRDYGIDGQLGLESTFEEYINNLCNIFDEVKRVLRDDGTIWVNLGDTYYGSGKGVGGDLEKSKEVYQMPKEWKRPSRDEFSKAGIKKNCLICKKEFLGKENSQFCSTKCLNKKGNDFRSQNRQLPDKCLTMIPFRFAIEMINRGWILRNVIIWYKPNCMPSSVKDRFTVDFEYVFFFSKKKKYYFETQYEPLLYQDNRVGDNRKEYSGKWNKSGTTQNSFHYANPKGRNKRSVWKISPKPFPESHFAVYPEELCETPIKAGCPEFVCVKCGSPKIQIYSDERLNTRPGKNTGTGKSGTKKDPNKELHNSDLSKYRQQIIYKSQGYKPTCKCNSDFTGGIVLDMFFGSGTTGLVALKQNKKFIGIELNPEYIEIAKKRLKPYLEQKKLNFPSNVNLKDQSHKEKKK